MRRGILTGRRRRIGVALGLSAGLALTGCAVAQGGVGVKEPPARVLNISNIDTFVLPLDAYAPTPAQRLSVQVAERTLVARCLDRLGVEADLPQPRSRPFPPNTRRYGITDEARATAFGYSAPEISKRPRTPEPARRLQQIVSGKGAPTVGGKKVPHGGCAGEADRLLDAGIAVPKPDETIVGRLGLATLLRSEKDSRVRAGFAQWSACMKQAGYDYATPREANQDPAFTDGRKHQVTRLETATAVADVRCKKKTNLINVWAGVETAYQKLAIAQNRAKLDAAREAARTRVANAAAVTTPAR